MDNRSQFRRRMELELTMRSLFKSALARATRQLAERYIWTHSSIAQTFRCRPTYQASFKKTWLSLMWGGEAGTRRLRESIAVAISAANQCFY
jgi:Carboxymuconolactone decarboxylase family